MKRLVIFLLWMFLIGYSASAQEYEKAFDVVEQMPTFPGGQRALMSWM